MNKRIWRCLFADLAAGTLELKTRKTLPRKTAGDALVLATDVLAGTGGLAFDRMTWRMPDGSKTTYTGRLAAALRYAGADALVLSGKRTNPGVLVLEGGAGHVDDIADINVSNVRIKEMLSTQIVNQNDSFGKLYEVTSRLDKYEPGEVLFYAAEVLAQLMGSKDVAIYSVANRSYARLFSATSQKARSLGNSINYVEMEEMYEELQEHKVYINKNMDERYPLMADAIYSEDNMQLILMVWGIPWERMTLGQANMLTVIGYLIQNAVLRANRYMSALEEQRYIEGTNILGQDAFRSLVKAYMNARNKELTECALLLIQTGDVSKEDAGQTLSKMIRQSDFLGELEDGNLYALLANTNDKSAEMVENRFREAGFECSIQEDDVV